MLQVAQSSSQAANRVSQSLLGSLVRSAEQSVRSDRSAADFAMALIFVIVKASQRVYAREHQHTARSSSYQEPKQGVSSLSLQQDAHSHGAAEVGSAAPPGGTAPDGVLAGRGSDIFALAIHSAAACTQQHCGTSSITEEQGAAAEHADTQSSSALPGYPMHELKVGPVLSAHGSNVFVPSETLSRTSMHQDILQMHWRNHASCRIGNEKDGALCSC